MSDLLLKTELYEIKRPNRWLITFDAPYDKIPSYALSKSSRPKLINSKWSDIEIILRDAIYPSTTEGLMNGLRKNF